MDSNTGYLKQLYSTAKTTVHTTHSHFRSLTTFLVNFIPVDKVDVAEVQVRVHFDDNEIQSLADSIRKHGVLTPILVVQASDRYKVIAGERRLRASKAAGLERIPARVLTSADDTLQEIALRENLDRVDLHPIEEGEGYLNLLESGIYTSHESLSKGFGKPKSRITECIGFTRLPQKTQETLFTHGLRNRALLRKLLRLPENQHVAFLQREIARENGEITNPSRRASKTKLQTHHWSGSGAQQLRVTSFRWNESEGLEPLQKYAQSLRSLLQEIEQRLSEKSLS